tara:strand:- start:7315 stop:7986 length:672 start_codon:yes stop_codon:yes gene_type:complete
VAIKDIIFEKLKNKNVVLVGNSVEILNYKKADFIESHDVVIRMGRGIPRPRHYEAIGKRTDIWATGFLRAEQMVHKPQLEGVPKLLNRTRINLLTARNHASDITHELHTMFSDEELLEIYDEFGYENNAVLGRPSNGFIVLLWLIKKAWVWKKLSIVGFDFFAKAAPFKVGAAYPNSWHLPRNSVDEIPHNVPAEREYALEMSRNGVIHWEILSDLKPEILDE